MQITKHPPSPTKHISRNHVRENPRLSLSLPCARAHAPSPRPYPPAPPPRHRRNRLGHPQNLPALTPLLSANPSSSVQTLVLPFPPHPKIPPGVENVKDIGPHGNLAVIDALTNLHDPNVAPSPISP
ncbi:hypothetical protein COP2_021336 [Malus domestica]